MSSLASHVILHPTVSQTSKLLATTVGRDKTYRAIQYFARFFAWYLIRNGYNVEGARWNNLKSSLASGRKLMRLFKPLDNLQAVVRATQTAATAPEQITTIARQLGYAAYLTYDMLGWAHSIRFITFTPQRAAKINKTALRFWLAGILFSILHGILKAGRLANEAKALRQSSEKASLSDHATRQALLSTISAQREANRHQFALDILDVWLPASGLELVNFSDGLVGILGFISSILALRKQFAVTASK